MAGEEEMTTDVVPVVRTKELAALVGKYLPALREHSGKRTEFKGGGTEPDGTILLAYPCYPPGVDAFLDECVERKVVFPFDWPQFHERAAELIAEGGIECASVEELRRLLTTFVRQERFGPGVIGEMVESGVLLRVLERLAVLCEAPR
jgi:hypothetical protein